MRNKLDLFKDAVVIKVQSGITKMTRLTILTIYQGLSVNQFSKHLEAVILA